MFGYTYNIDKFHGCVWFLPQNEYALGPTWIKLREGHVDWRLNHKNIQCLPFRLRCKIKRHPLSPTALHHSGRTPHRALHPPHVLPSVGFQDAIHSFGHPISVAPSRSLLLFLLVSLSYINILSLWFQKAHGINSHLNDPGPPTWASLLWLPWVISVPNNCILAVA